MTNTVEVPLEAALVDDVVVVTGAFDLALADYDVTAPTAPIVLGVADTATVELQLYFAPAEGRAQWRGAQWRGVGSRP